VGRTYVVGSPASIAALAASGTAQTPPVTAVLSYLYSSPEDIAGTLKQATPDLKVTPGKSNGGQGGVLIVTGSQSDVDRARQLVADAEGALSRNIAASQTVIYNIKYASADDLQSVLGRLVPNLVVTPGPSQGFHLQAPSTADAGGATSTTASYGTTAPAGATGAASTGSVATKTTTNSLLLTGTDADVTRARQLLATVDVRPAQINYEAKVTEINLNSLKNLGLKFDFSGASTTIGEEPSGYIQDPTQPAGTLMKQPNPPFDPYPGNVGKLRTFGRSFITNFVTVGLDALFTSGDAKLLSNPNISAVDGQPAAAFIGDTLRYVSSITQTPTGQTVTTDSVNIGIKLFVTGKVNNDGYITLNIHPEVSTISGFLAVPGGGSLPQVSTREATTTVRVRDGETIAIGGLISENDIKNVQKVPFLGDLPFIGSLFKNTSHTHRRDEVVIFVKVSLSKDGTVSAS
jgi:type II secretory pathway component GspD/PulD (secretin)